MFTFSPSVQIIGNLEGQGVSLCAQTLLLLGQDRGLTVIQPKLSLCFFCLCLLESSSGLTDFQPNGYERIRRPGFTECLCVRIPLEPGPSVLIGGVEVSGWCRPPVWVTGHCQEIRPECACFGQHVCSHRVPSAALFHALQHCAEARGHRQEFGCRRS